MARNFLVPDIDTSGIRSTDIQAKQAQGLGMQNYLMQHNIENLPVQEARASEKHEMEMDEKQFDMMKAKMAHIRDIGFSHVTPSTYDDLVDYMNEVGLPAAKMMKPVDEINKMSPGQFDKYKNTLIQNADSMIAKDKSQFEEDAAKERVQIQQREANYRARLSKEASIEAAKIKKEGGGKSAFKAADANSIAKKVDKYLTNPITGLPDLPTQKDGKDISQEQYMEAVANVKDKRAAIEAKAEQIYRDTPATHGQAVIQAIMELSQQAQQNVSRGTPKADWRKYTTGGNKLEIGKPISTLKRGEKNPAGKNKLELGASH